MFGESTYKWLPARSMEKTRYMILMVDVPESFNGVATVELKRGSVLVRENKARRVLRIGVKSFL